MITDEQRKVAAEIAGHLTDAESANDHNFAFIVGLASTRLQILVSSLPSTYSEVNQLSKLLMDFNKKLEATRLSKDAELEALYIEQSQQITQVMLRQILIETISNQQNSHDQH